MHRQNAQLESQESAKNILRDEEKIKPCLMCFAPNDESAEFCTECGSPFGVQSVLSPYQVIGPDGPRWRGIINRRRIKRKPSFIVLLTVWIVYPFLLFVSGYIIYMVTCERQGLLDFFGFWLGIGIALFSLKYLIGTTKYYFKSRKPPLSENHKHKSQSSVATKE